MLVFQPTIREPFSFAGARNILNVSTQKGGAERLSP